MMADYANRTDPEASNFEENSELEETSFDEEDSSSDDTSEQ